MTMTKVSIIIPCYNDGKYLPEALASAKAQTYPDVEIIVVNDHSTDALTLDMLQKTVAQGITVLETPIGKKGPSAARNVGIGAAAGEFILPLDADDRIDPTYAEKALERMRNPSVGICHCKTQLFGLKRGLWKLPPYSWEEMLTGNVIIPTAMFRKCDWQSLGGYDESLLVGLEDYAFWLRLIDLGRDIVQIDEILFHYRIRKFSRTAIVAKGRREEEVLEDVYRSCEAVLSRNTLPLFKKVHRLKQEKNNLHCLVSWKLLRPVFALEWKLRQFVKKLTGRC